MSKVLDGGSELATQFPCQLDEKAMADYCCLYAYTPDCICFVEFIKKIKKKILQFCLH